jgi:hypothetical protein
MKFTNYWMEEWINKCQIIESGQSKSDRESESKVIGAGQILEIKV